MGFTNNDLVQSAIEAQIANEENKEEERLDFNPLQLYFGDDYVVNDKITIHQPLRIHNEYRILLDIYTRQQKKSRILCQTSFFLLFLPDI